MKLKLSLFVTSICLFFTLFLTSGKVSAAERICGIQSNLSNMTDATVAT